ncbi:recombinase RecA [Mycoplasma crocodyli]|uniref:Protein RecA n=1 Tax=Mycoplasma crocodyli (strain ATCC 51981 / MP145) TaxID=512564 RepID=D5E501_MYCCM|nr:recombinase RecA [Mycoplasma crocodyli]ADE19603.1 Recombinase protein RecA [Mycoplasma crocodyli MP145]
MIKEEEKNIIIKEALNAIGKKFGKESIMLLGSVTDVTIDTFSSGSHSLNKILGVGGFPKGRIIEIYGPESSGKTTVCLHAIAEIQKKGGLAAFIDAEHSIDPNYASNIGVKVDELILSQPDSGEQALEIVDLLARSGNIDLIVVDSVAALVPEAELQGEMKDQQIGTQARLMSKALRKIAGTLNKNKTTVIFVNQIREKVGVIFGNPETTSGGRALKFYASIRVEVRKGANISDSKDIVGNEIKFKVVKNKLAAPYKSATSEIIFSRGINATKELIDLAIEANLISKKGSWYSIDDKNVAQGEKSLEAYIEDNIDLKNDLMKKLNLI